MRVRLLAITPPEGPVDPAIVDAWGLDARAPDLALLVRRRGRSIARALADPHLAALLERVAALHVPILVSCDAGDLDGIEHAAATGCAGVQLRSDPDARAVVEARRAGARIVGASMHAPAPVDLPPADYLCVAPVFAPRTPTPGHTKRATGLASLAAFCGHGVDVLALGGVTGRTAAACAAAGATGFASIRSFFGRSAEVADDVAAFRAALTAGRAPP